MAIYHNIGKGDPHTATAGVADIAKRIADTGFDSIWFADCIGRAGTLMPDPLMMICVAATATKEIELGTCIVQVPDDDNLSVRLEHLAAAGYDDAVIFPDDYSEKTLSGLRRVIP